MISIAFLMFGVLSFMGPAWRLFYCFIGVILFGFYLLFDTQLIVGKGQHKLSPEDFILGAIMLYLDIINIFLYILRILSSK